jgi:hypothetical protein
MLSGPAVSTGAPCFSEDKARFPSSAFSLP